MSLHAVGDDEGRPAKPPPEPDRLTEQRRRVACYVWAVFNEAELTSIERRAMEVMETWRR